MKHSRTIIFAGDSSYKVGRGGSVVEVPIVAGAASIKSVVTSQTVTLAIPSSWCLSAAVSTDGLPQRNRRTAMIYRLETSLPVTAEEIAVDFIGGDQPVALGIVGTVATIKPVVDFLEAGGVCVDTIVPTSLYAVLPFSDGRFGAVVWGDSESVDVFMFRGGRVVGWYLLPSVAADIRECLGRFTGADRPPVRVGVCHVTAEVTAAIQNDPQLDVTVLEDQTVEAAAARVSQSQPPGLNLRRDGLAPADPLRAVRRSLSQAVAAAVLLVVCVAGGAVWRGNQYERLAELSRRRQADTFRATFPGRRVPVNIASRFRSEQQLAASGSNATTALNSSAITTLTDVLTAVQAMPAGSKFQVQDLRVTDGTFSLEATVRARADSDGLLEALRGRAALRVEAPQVEQVAGKGIHVLVTGSAVEQPKR